MDTNSLFLISTGLLILIPVLKKITTKERKLFYILLSILFFQFVLVFVMHFDLKRFYHPFVTQSKFYNDGEAYSDNALIIANTLNNRVTEESFFYNIPGIQRVSGEVMEAAKKSEIVDMRAYEVGIITYIYAVIYAVYGYAPAFLNFINMCVNIFTALLIFNIAKNNFDRTAAYISTTLFLFWPTIFYYSATKVKEPLIILCTFFIIFIWSRLKNKYLLVSLTAFLLLILELLRPGFAKIISFVILLNLYFSLASRFKSVSKVSVISIIFILLTIPQKVYGKIIEFFVRCAYYHKGFVETGGVIYSLYGSNFNSIMEYGLRDWLFYLIRGWYHFLFEPLLSTGGSLMTVLYYPFKAIFILILILAFFGAINSLKHNNKINVLLISLFLICGTIYACTEANLGTMLRHRDLIAPVAFMYGAYFLSRIIPKPFSITEE